MADLANDDVDSSNDSPATESDYEQPKFDDDEVFDVPEAYLQPPTCNWASN
jgi:hypothetical protein